MTCQLDEDPADSREQSGDLDQWGSLIQHARVVKKVLRVCKDLSGVRRVIVNKFYLTLRNTVIVSSGYKGVHVNRNYWA